jgi:hypothetical protein
MSLMITWRSNLKGEIATFSRKKGVLEADAISHIFKLSHTFLLSGLKT